MPVNHEIMRGTTHVMLRPQYHWTDQKLHVHVFTCVLSYLFARLLHLRAQQALGYTRSMERLLDTLTQIRRVDIVRSTQKKGVRVTSQLEEVDPDVAKLIEALAIQA